MTIRSVDSGLGFPCSRLCLLEIGHVRCPESVFCFDFCVMDRLSRRVRFENSRGLSRALNALLLSCSASSCHHNQRKKPSLLYTCICSAALAIETFFFLVRCDCWLEIVPSGVRPCPHPDGARRTKVVLRLAQLLSRNRNGPDRTGHSRPGGASAADAGGACDVHGVVVESCERRCLIRQK